jgi:hypothetical protein
MKLIRLFLSDRKFRVLVEGELSAPWEIWAGGTTGLRPVPCLVQNVYIPHHKEGYVLRILQYGLTLLELWCECWNIKIRPSVSLITIDWSRLILHWKNWASHLWII